jgi:putative tryptophan/tyrosine transport system substrate-binding protein
MKRRRFIQALIAAPLAWPLDARAADIAKMHSLGLLGATSRAEYAGFVEAMEAGLRQLGYINGKNIAIHYRWAEGKYELLPALAADLVQLKVDVILTHGTPGTRAAKAATTTIPIVAILIGDVIETGLVPSLAHPGGNLTGQTFFFAEVNSKRLELIKEAVPGAARVAVLVNPMNQARHVAIVAMKATAQALRLELLPVEVSDRDQLASAFAMMEKNGAHALVMFDDPIFNSNAEYVAELALGSRIPLIAGKYGRNFRGLMIYGVDFRDLWFRSATFVDQILKGARPADLPIQRATKFELIVNLGTAHALGLTVAPALLARADEVID